MGIKVTLRLKPITKDRQALYLDFYPPVTDIHTGKLTRRMFLNKYIFNEFVYETVKVIDCNGKEYSKVQIAKDKKNREIKVKLTADQLKHNESAKRIAESTRWQKENELSKPEIYNELEREQLRLNEIGEMDFVTYFKKLADKRYGSNRDLWLIAIKYFEAFTNKPVKFSEISIKLCNDYRDYLIGAASIHRKESKIATNTSLSYFNKLKATLRQAYKDGLLQTDINAQINTVKPEENLREILTLEELNLLVGTPCEDQTLKSAALFSALTGLRHSDIRKLTWGEIRNDTDQGFSIRFRQQKTEGDELLPVSHQAIQMLGTPGESHEKIFPDLVYSAFKNEILDDWIKAAKINKHIRFHSFRHTNATLLLSAGTDIYTVSKMLGHRSIKTTQIYAKVLDKAKREAAGRIKLNF